jgi:hypothetical protein
MSVEGSGRVSFHPPTVAMSEGANTVITDCHASVKRVDMAATQVVDSMSNAKSVDSDAKPPEPGVALYDLKPNQCFYAVAAIPLVLRSSDSIRQSFLCPAHHELCYPTIAARNDKPAVKARAARSHAADVRL